MYHPLKLIHISRHLMYSPILYLLAGEFHLRGCGGSPAMRLGWGNLQGSDSKRGMFRIRSLPSAWSNRRSLLRWWVCLTQHSKSVMSSVGSDVLVLFLALMHMCCEAFQYCMRMYRWFARCCVVNLVVCSAFASHPLSCIWIELFSSDNIWNGVVGYLVHFPTLAALYVSVIIIIPTTRSTSNKVAPNDPSG